MTNQLILPALKAQMGDWNYYITFMRMADIADRVSTVEDIHTSKSLRELLQRRLTGRTKEIKEYLKTQPQRFFNALVIGTYGGNPQWRELQIRQTDDVELPIYLEGALGVLILDGSERLFAIDGQHRIVGIKNATIDKPGLREEEVCAIFVAGVSQSARSRDEEGFQRTRRLFSTLNRYAKPVSKGDIIALDEDDTVAIITRRLVEEYSSLDGKISKNLTKNISIKDKRSLTTIVTLYEVLDIFMRNKSITEWVKFKRTRPSDSILEEFYGKAINFWKKLEINFKPMQLILESKPEDEIAANYRHNGGGHLLFRPIGLLLYGKVIKKLMDSELSYRNSVNRFAKIPMELSEEPWVGLLWDKTNQRMLTSPENQKIGFQMAFHSIGGDLLKLRSRSTSRKKLKKELAGILNQNVNEVNLPIFFN